MRLAEGMVAATAAQRELAQAEDADILGKFDPAENEIVTFDGCRARRVQSGRRIRLLAEQRKIAG